MKIDVRVASERAFLHFAVGHAEIAEREPKLFKTRASIFRGADFGLADDLQERNPRAVQVNLGERAVAVGEFAGVFLEVDACQSAAASPGAVLARRDQERAPLAEGEVVLTDLIVLGEVGIVIVLTVPLGELGDLRAER